MNVVFVNPPNHRFDVDDLAPPLGLLMLADTVSQIGAHCTIIDLNLDSCREAMPEPRDFYRAYCEPILAFDPDVLCFTSMAINSHVALELGRHLKSLKPSIVTVFGGSHFSSIAADLKRRFWWVDYVNIGAGECSFQRLVSSLHKGKPPLSPFLMDEGGQSTPEVSHP